VRTYKMKRTYSVKFKSASKKLTTPEKVEATKKAILEEAKADAVEIADDGQIVTIEADESRFSEVMNGVVNVFRKIDDKSEVSYKFALNHNLN
jgi:phage-related protein